MNNLKRFSGFFLVAVVFMSSTVFAYDEESDFHDNIYEAGYSITETIHYIVENYYYEDVTTEDLYEAAMTGIFSKLDAFSQFFSREEIKEFEDSLGNYGLFLNVNIIEKNGRVFVDSLIEEDTNETSLMINDEILKINGKSIFNMSRISIFNHIYNAKNNLKLEILRNSKTLYLVVEKKDVVSSEIGSAGISEVAPYIKDDDGSIKYILLKTISSTTQAELKKITDEYKNQGVKKLIIDLRDNTGGTVNEAGKILQSLVSEGPVMKIINNSGDKDIINSVLKEKPFEIALLTNNYTASAAEIIAIGIKEDGNFTVGDKTFGKGVGQVIIDTGYKNTSYKLTILEAFSGNDTKIHDVGITPDYYVYTPNFIYSLDDIDVINVKNILKHLGYAVGNMENNWDYQTVNSIVEFQTKKELNPTGVLDLDTVLNLNYDLTKAYIKKDDVLIKAYEVLKDK